MATNQELLNEFFESLRGLGMENMKLVDDATEFSQSSTFTNEHLSAYGWQSHDAGQLQHTVVSMMHDQVRPFVEGIGLRIQPQLATWSHSTASGGRVGLLHLKKEYPATGAMCGLLIDVHQGVLIGCDYISPSDSLKQGKYQLKGGQSLVPLQDWCDIAWLAWRHACGSDDKAKGLRYVVRVGSEDLTDTAIKHALSGHGTTGNRLIPAQFFEKDTREAQVIMGSPMGKECARLVSEHHAVLGSTKIKRVTASINSGLMGMGSVFAIELQRG